MKPDAMLCRSHPDFHLPADVEVGEGFDGDAYARRLKENGADAVAIFAKCHYGHSYYYTKVGYRHPGLKNDMIAEVVCGCRKHGLGVIGYYSVFLDTAAVRQHPDWQLQADSKIGSGYGNANFQALCVNSPYLEELLIPQCVEVVTQYELDELLLDTMTGFQPCYCPRCRQRFGRDIPQSTDDPNWLQYVRWYAECYEKFYARAVAAIHEARPQVPTLFNWEWSFRRPAPPVPHVQHLTADLMSSGTIASQVCRYYAGTGLAFDYMTGRFMHGLGDWNSNTPESMLYTAAITVANGGNFYIIDRQLPDGSMEDRAFEMMGTVFGFVNQRRPWLVGARHAPEVAVLHSYDSLMGDDLRFFPDTKARTERLTPYEGVTRLFMEHGRHFTAMNEQRLVQCIKDYRVVIVPEQEYLAVETRRALREFVQQEGKLIITQSAWGGEVDGELLELAGVRYKGPGPLHYGYVATNPPLLLRCNFAQIEPLAGTQTLYGYVPPMAGADGAKKFGHGFAPPTHPNGQAVITTRPVGRGQVVYVAVPFFKTYFDWQNPTQAKLMLDVLDRLLPDPLVKITTKAQVELSVMRKGDDLIVHLVNHSGRERLGGHFCPVTEYLPEIRDIDVAIRVRPHMGPVLSVPAQEQVAGRPADGYVIFTLPRLEVMESVCVPGYFSGH